MSSHQDSLRTVTVGPQSADVCGTTGAQIQIAIDALAYRGGGTVRVLPGEYELIDSIHLRQNIRLIGDRQGTILRRRGPVVWADLAEDADVGQTQIRPTKLDGFVPGMGVRTWDENLGWADHQPNPTVTDIADGLLHVNAYLRADRRAEHGGRVVNTYPMIHGFEQPNVHVEGFTLDANVDDPDGVVKTMRTAAIYLYRCPDSVIREVTVTGNHGDGICFGKTSLRTIVEDCETAHNGYYGIHPGSHSAYSKVRRCHIHHNVADGLYICWGISHGEFVDNDIHDNGIGMLRSGICIGHKDTDNLIARNKIRRNRKFGIAFRHKTEANGAHRNIVRDNLIEDNGSPASELAEIKAEIPSWEAIGAGVNICPVTKDLVFENNVIRETRTGEQATQRYGIWTREGVANVRLIGNTIEGHPDGDVRDEAGAIDQPQAEAQPVA